VLIEVKPYELKWGVYIDGVIFGVSKASCDADFCAWRLQAMFDEELPEVRNYPEDRQRLCAEMEEARKVAKAAAPKPQREPRPPVQESRPSFQQAKQEKVLYRRSMLAATPTREPGPGEFERKANERAAETTRTPEDAVE
jgi:hypothetical protein